MRLWQILVWCLLILYLLSPFDLLPDVFPVVGWLDDLLAMAGLYWYFARWYDRARPHAASGGGRDFNHREYETHDSDNGREQTQPADHAAADPWHVLQVTPQASAQEIAAAYRAQLLKYHPDRVAHLGDEFQRLAHRKTLEIQQAYTKLKRHSA
jgi:hypothetical protein